MLQGCKNNPSKVIHFLQIKTTVSPLPSVLNYVVGISMAFRWLTLHASNGGHADLIPGQGTKITSTLKSKIKEI